MINNCYIFPDDIPRKPSSITFAPVGVLMFSIWDSRFEFTCRITQIKVYSQKY